MGRWLLLLLLLGGVELSGLLENAPAVPDGHDQGNGGGNEDTEDPKDASEAHVRGLAPSQIEEI